MTDAELDALQTTLRLNDSYGYCQDAADAIEVLRAENARLLHLINMDFDCLPTCDKFGHAEGCPYVEGEPKLRILAERAEKAEADNAALREALQHIAEPLAWEQDHLEPGYEINGFMMMSMLDQPSYYREIARAALLAGKEGKMSREDYALHDELPPIGDPMAQSYTALLRRAKELEADNAALRLEIGSMRSSDWHKDAERYRWLRSNGIPSLSIMGFNDAAIDAAMREGKEGK